MEMQQLVEADLNTAYNSKKLTSAISYLLTPKPSFLKRNGVLAFLHGCARLIVVRTFLGKSTSSQCLRTWDLLGAGQQPLAASAPRGCVFHFAILLTDLVFWQAPMI